jgi:hypothetical protein
VSRLIPKELRYSKRNTPHPKKLVMHKFLWSDHKNSCSFAAMEQEFLQSLALAVAGEHSVASVLQRIVEGLR